MAEACRIQRGGEPQSESGQNLANTWLFTFVLLRQLKTWRKTTGAHSRSIRSSSWGGGIDDHTDRNGLDAVSGHQACLDGGQYAGPDSSRSGTKGHGHRFLATCRGASAGLGFRRGQVDVDLPRAPNSLRDARATQGANRPSHHGHGGDCETIRLNGGPIETHLAGNHHFSDSCVLVTAVAGGGDVK